MSKKTGHDGIEVCSFPDRFDSRRMEDDWQLRRTMMRGPTTTTTWLLLLMVVRMAADSLTTYRPLQDQPDGNQVE